MIMIAVIQSTPCRHKDHYTTNERVCERTQNFEPRVANIGVRVVYPLDTNELLIQIAYDIVGLTVISSSGLSSNIDKSE